jgi:hypothetical protein
MDVTNRQGALIKANWKKWSYFQTELRKFLGLQPSWWAPVGLVKRYELILPAGAYPDFAEDVCRGEINGSISFYDYCRGFSRSIGLRATPVAAVPLEPAQKERVEKSEEDWSLFRAWSGGSWEIGAWELLSCLKIHLTSVGAAESWLRDCIRLAEERFDRSNGKDKVVTFDKFVELKSEMQVKWCRGEVSRLWERWKNSVSDARRRTSSVAPTAGTGIEALTAGRTKMATAASSERKGMTPADRREARALRVSRGSKAGLVKSNGGRRLMTAAGITAAPPDGRRTHIGAHTGRGRQVRSAEDTAARLASMADATVAGMAKRIIEGVTRGECLRGGPDAPMGGQVPPWGNRCRAGAPVGDQSGSGGGPDEVAAGRMAAPRPWKRTPPDKPRRVVSRRGRGNRPWNEELRAATPPKNKRAARDKEPRKGKQVIKAKKSSKRWRRSRKKKRWRKPESRPGPKAAPKRSKAQVPPGGGGDEFEEVKWTGLCGQQAWLVMLGARMGVG